jgi:hypothetical protein
VEGEGRVGEYEGDGEREMLRGGVRGRTETRRGSGGRGGRAGRRPDVACFENLDDHSSSDVGATVTEACQFSRSSEEREKTHAESPVIRTLRSFSPVLFIPMHCPFVPCRRE